MGGQRDESVEDLGFSAEVAEVRAELVDHRSESGPAREPASESQAALDLHVCMGLNACQGAGVRGTGDMAGMGECATVFHNCHGESACRNQGGCGYAGSDVEQAYPGQQECRNNGAIYPEGARICSNNLTLLCVNGEWQNLDGARCSDPGTYLNPDQAYIVQDPVIEVPEPLPPPSWAR